MARALNSTACDAVYDVACGHGLVGLLVAYRYPKINLVSIDRERRPAFKAWSTAMQSVKSRRVGLDAPSQHAPSQSMLPNVQFLEGDFQELDLLDMLTSAPSLVLCVHGCNEVNRDAVELARKAAVGWVAIPCCLRVELYLSVDHFKLPDELRYAVLCGAMASCYQAKSVAVINRRITNRAIVLTGGLTEVSTRLQESEAGSPCEAPCGAPCEAPCEAPSETCQTWSWRHAAAAAAVVVVGVFAYKKKK